MLLKFTLKIVKFIINLYTIISIIDTLNIIMEYANNDDKFTKKTTIPKDKSLDLANLVFTPTWCTLNSEL